jgi:hypothetical protein
MTREREVSSTLYPIMFFMADIDDHLTGLAGLTPTVTLSKNGAAFGAALGAIVEVGNGWYSLAGNATDRNRLGTLLIHAEATGADPFDVDYSIVEAVSVDDDVVLPSVSDIVAAVKAFTFLSVQSVTEASTASNMEAALLYNDSSEQQGNFTLFYLEAQTQLAADLAAKSIALNALQTRRAYAYLIQHFYEMKFKDWNATDINLNNDLVKRPVGYLTSGWSAYSGLLSDVRRATSGAMDTTITKHNDETNFPDDWRDIPEDPITLDVV